MHIHSHKHEVKTDDQSRSSALGLTEVANVDAADRHNRIAEAAYYSAERRGFSPGSALDDWLMAEREVAKFQPRKS